MDKSDKTINELTIMTLELGLKHNIEFEKSWTY